MTRALTAMAAGLLVWAAGCGGSSSAPAPTGKQPDPGPDPVTTTPTQTPPAADPHEMDPAKHVVPDRPVAGKLRGKPFTPDRVELEGTKLTFRQGKDFFADLEVSINLTEKSGSQDKGWKLTVRPDQKWSDGIPSLLVSAREDKKGVPDTKFVNDDYALTLELGKLEKGKAPGKVYLSLPDSQRSYLAGTFVAERKRTLSEPPGPDDAPFIQGKVEPPLKKGQSVSVGYVARLADGKVISDGAGSELHGDGSGGGARSMTFRPRTAGVRFEKYVPRFDFTHLPPGRYLVYARVKDGPTGWKWVDVKAGDQTTADLTLDAKAAGTVEVKVPPKVDEVRLAPADLGVPDPTGQLLTQVGYSLDLMAKAKDGKATVAHVPAGKYVVLGSGGSAQSRGEVEVAAGKTATVELMPAKK